MDWIDGIVRLACSNDFRWVDVIEKFMFLYKSRDLRF